MACVVVVVGLAGALVVVVDALAGPLAVVVVLGLGVVIGGVVIGGSRSVVTVSGPNSPPLLFLFAAPGAAGGSSSGGTDGISEGVDDGPDEHAVLRPMAPATSTIQAALCGDLTRNLPGVE
jgi:hypothetical protein